MHKFAIPRISHDVAVNEMYDTVHEAEEWRAKFIDDFLLGWALRLTRIEFQDLKTSRMIDVYRKLPKRNNPGGLVLIVADAQGIEEFMVVLVTSTIKEEPPQR